MRKIKFLFLIFFAVLLGLITHGFSIFLLYHNAYLHSAGDFFQHHQALFISVHIGLFSLFIFFWPSLIRFVGKQRQWSMDTIHYISNQWWRLLLLWLAIEILWVLPQLF